MGTAFPRGPTWRTCSKPHMLAHACMDLHALHSPHEAPSLAACRCGKKRRYFISSCKHRHAQGSVQTVQNGSGKHLRLLLTRAALAGDSTLIGVGSSPGLQVVAGVLWGRRRCEKQGRLDAFTGGVKLCKGLALTNRVEAVLLFCSVLAHTHLNIGLKPEGLGDCSR